MLNVKGLFLAGMIQEMFLGASVKGMLSGSANYRNLSDLHWCKGFGLSFSRLVVEASEIFESAKAKGITSFSDIYQSKMLQNRISLCNNLLSIAIAIGEDVYRDGFDPFSDPMPAVKYLDIIQTVNGDLEFVNALGVELAQERLEFEKVFSQI